MQIYFFFNDSETAQFGILFNFMIKHYLFNVIVILQYVTNVTKKYEYL